MDQAPKGDALKADLNIENVLKVIQGMHSVVESGTGGSARIPNLEVCGKTGTAQLASNDLLNSAAGRHMKDNGWFVGFAPKQSPEIVVVALFEGGEHGTAAAPIVRDVIKAHFDKRMRQSPEQRLASLPSFGVKSTALQARPQAVPEAVVARFGDARAEVVR